MCSAPFPQKPLVQPQPFWKPRLYKGRQRVHFKMQETVTGFMSQNVEIKNSTYKLLGQIFCCADIENLPDITVPLLYKKTQENDFEWIFHECNRVTDSIHKQPTALCFSPPLGWFTLASYTQKRIQNEPTQPIWCRFDIKILDESKVSFEATLDIGEDIIQYITSCTVCLKIQSDIEIEEEPQSSAGYFFKDKMTWNPMSNNMGISERESLTGFIHLPEYQSIYDLEKKLEKEAYATLDWEVSGKAVSGITVDTASTSLYPNKSFLIHNAIESNGERILVKPKVLMPDGY